MPQRQCSIVKTEAAKPAKRICLPISRETYAAMIDEQQCFREMLDGLIESHPELFPAEIKEGYHLYGFARQSVKMAAVKIRRISLPVERGGTAIYTVVPSFVLPYRVGYTEDVEKALFLRRFGVPFWALPYVFGRHDLYWQCLVAQLGRHDIVGTTLKDADQLPEHLLADEKHPRLNGEKAYMATTVAADCILGALLTLEADEVQLSEAYAPFKHEAQRLSPHYQPQTVNTDGWSPTPLAWQALFSTITIIILRFLHAFLSIRSRAKHLQATFAAISQRVWNVYHAHNVESFSQRLADLQVWAKDQVTGPSLEAILKLCSQADRFALAFAYPLAYRTSNRLDRQLDALDRCLYAAHYFHGPLMSAEYQVRAWAWFHNFQPYCPRAKIRQRYQSPFHKLNGFVYHDNWLQNLLVAASLGGRYATNAIR
jgi:hypothetical protein